MQKRANENKADLFKEVGLGMSLRKRQKVDASDG